MQLVLPASWLTAPKWMSCLVGNNYFVFSLGGLFPALNFSDRHSHRCPAGVCYSSQPFSSLRFTSCGEMQTAIVISEPRSYVLGSLDLLSLPADSTDTLWKCFLQCSAHQVMLWLAAVPPQHQRKVSMPRHLELCFPFLSLKDCIADSLLKWLWTQFDSRHNLGILTAWDIQMWFFCLVLALAKPLILIMHLIQCFCSYSLPIKSCFVLNSLLFLQKGFLSSCVREGSTTH